VREGFLLPFDEGLVRTTPFDQDCRRLADKHYTRRKGSIGKPQFTYSGRKLVLRDAAGTCVFAWVWPQDDKRMDGQFGYNCAIFRNESSRRASDIILEAESAAVEKWGPGRAYTFVDSRKIQRTRQPGRCFLKAGWKYQRDLDGKPLLTKSGKHILEKFLAGINDGGVRRT